MPKKRACDACYRRKIECVIAEQDTPCDWCQHHGLDCTFVRERPKRKQRKRAQSSDVQELTRRVAQLEDALPCPGPSDAASNTASPSLVATPVTTTSSRISARDGYTPQAVNSHVTSPCHVVSPKSLHSAARHLGPHWFFDGIPIFSEEGQKWVSLRTGQQVQWSEFRFPIYERKLLASSHPSEEDASLLVLLNRDTAQQIIGSFFSTRAAVALTLMDPILFDMTIETAYDRIDDPLPSPKHVVARACLLAAVSVASRLGAAGASLSSSDTEKFANTAERLITLNPGYMSLDSLITMLLLQVEKQMKYTLSGNWEDATFYHTIACRTVCALGYHINVPPDCGASAVASAPSLEERAIHHGRKLFWLCYTSDKDISLHTSIPPLLIDEFCDLTLTHDSSSNITHVPSPAMSPDTDQTDDSIVVLPGDIRLGRIKERVCRLFYSPKAFKDFDIQLLHNISHLDDEIEQWRLSIPPPRRPALISSSFFNSFGSGVEGMCHILLELDYLYLMVVVHMSVRRFRSYTADINDIAEDRHRLIHSSVDISLEASRSILGCLKAMINTFADKAFWPVIRYAAPAATTIVLEMLVHPRSEQAQSDLEILIAASNFIRCMRVTTLDLSEVAYIKDTSSFIMELVFLGTCAVRKANRDEAD